MAVSQPSQPAVTAGTTDLELAQIDASRLYRTLLEDVEAASTKRRTEEAPAKSAADAPAAPAEAPPAPAAETGGGNADA